MLDYEVFELTDAHLTLLRHASVSWNADEYGAPTIDPKRPYGHGAARADMTAILSGMLDPSQLLDITVLDRLHCETETALQIVLRTGTFVPGRYIAERYTQDWRKDTT